MTKLMKIKILSNQIKESLKEHSVLGSEKLVPVTNIRGNIKFKQVGYEFKNLDISLLLKI